ncbi:HD-GYP domain-containing protein [Tuberibacillus sp. Marseille-P3662]|uniref:HD-GYP domain-containing protein n=1 Tax=Tuberibacillus sp. Marseille-P3662 TaxID=1965358 RepID=UPI0015942EAD|nr:HD domain-containing phosphohydrolase [Tuberibacillus sp. Marseille-P3662]
MNHRRIKTDNLIPELRLVQDLYDDHHTLVYPAGTLLDQANLAAIQQMPVNDVIIAPPDSSMSKKHLRQLFFQTMREIGMEARYGRLMNQSSTYEWLADLFVRLMSDAWTAHLLFSLKQWDVYCFNHSVDVFVLGTSLARKTGNTDLDTFARGCLLHDIGKRFVPSEILQKRGKLTQREYHAVKQHTSKGAYMLEDLGFSHREARLARSHHERLDGSGYPDGLTTETLDQDIKTIMIIDVYSALTLERPYRRPLPANQAIERVLNDHHQYDPFFYFAFMEMLDIYPPQAEVELSDGQKAWTVYKKDTDGPVPVVRLHGNTDPLQLPANLSLVVKRVIGWNDERVQQLTQYHQTQFIQSLLDNHYHTALELFDVLTDGMRVEEIYADIIELNAKYLSRQKRIGEMTSRAYDTAIEVLMAIMDNKMSEFYPSIQHTGEKMILINMRARQRPSLFDKLIHDVFTVNGWDIYHLDQGVSPESMSQMMNRYHVNHVVFVIDDDQTQHTFQTFLSNIQRWVPSCFLMAYVHQETHWRPDGVDIYAHSIRDILSQMKTKHLLSS